MKFCRVDSPVGILTVVQSAKGVREIAYGQVDTEGFDEVVELPCARQLAEYFAGTRTTFELPLDPVGTEFQQGVWAQLLRIPYGEIRTYGEVALALGRPTASRAVGMATGRNPLSIVVPCHRVIGANGRLTGYAGGLERKSALLALESPERGLFA
jgi:methylated-DNA-[protein]-cysteine S-methyltransferase